MIFRSLYSNQNFFRKSYLQDEISERITGSTNNYYNNSYFGVKSTSTNPSDSVTIRVPKSRKKKNDNPALKKALIIAGTVVATYIFRGAIGKVLSGISKCGSKVGSKFTYKYPNLSAAIDNGPIGITKRLLSKLHK